MARDKTNFTAENHKQAFEIYAKHRQFAAVEKELRHTGVSYDIIRTWAKDGFRCPFGCPWHNWASLLEERAKVVRSQVKLIENGVGESETLRVAAESELNKVPQKNEVKNGLLKVVKSDLERLAQLELLYNKAYFKLTGIALVVGDMDLGEQKIHLEEMYEKGLNPETFSGGIRDLSTLLGQIDTLKKRLGLIAEDGREVEDPKKDVEEVRPLNVRDLVKLKEQMLNTDPENLAVMISQMDKDRRDQKIVEGALAGG